MSTAWMDVYKFLKKYVDSLNGCFKFLTKNMSTAWMDVYKFLTKICPQPEWMSISS